LGAAIRALRGDVTTTELARRAGIDRTVVSKVEAGERRASLDTVLRILDALPLAESGREYRTLQRVTRDGLARGWWDDPQYDGMGERQARTADLECGASIREYQNSMLPGLLQTEAYARHRGEVAVDKGGRVDLDATVRGRLRRQRQRSDVPHLDYQVVLEPQAVWRCPVPLDVMREQLLHLREVATADNGISVRLLPVDARLPVGWVPRSPFAVYDYPDDDDLTVVSVDTVSTDLVITDPAGAAEYAHLFDGLRDSALSPRDSAAVIGQAVDALVTGA
jgi:transcriptional regulator with XRE-family HTH domain